VRRPYEGCSVRYAGSPARDRAKLRPIDTPWCGGSGLTVGSAKHAGGVRVKARTRQWPEHPGRVKPKGAASGCRTNPAVVARDSGQGESPEAAARWAGPPFRRRENRRDKTACGFIRGGNAAGTCREEEAPKG